MKRNEITAGVLLFFIGVLLLTNNIYSEKRFELQETHQEDELVQSVKKESVLKKEDPDIFKKISPTYVTDGKSIFYRTSIRTEGFSIINGNLVRDKYAVYWKGQQLSLNPNKIKVFQYENGGLKAVYDDNFLYLLTEYNAILIKGVSTSTFIFLNGPYAKDANHVYYLDHDYENTKIDILPDADPKTFVMIGTCQAVETASATYAKDSKNVYVQKTIVPEGDAATFTIIDSFSSRDGEMPMVYSYAKDKDTIFYNCGNVLKEADYGTFEYLGEGKAQDKNNTYDLGEFNAFIKKKN